MINPADRGKKRGNKSKFDLSDWNNINKEPRLF